MICTLAACSRHPGPNDTYGSTAAPGVASAAAGTENPAILPAWSAAASLAEPPVKLAPGVAAVAVHVPEGYDASKPIHLVLFFHGSGSCATQLAMTGDVVCKPGEAPMVGAGLAARHDDAGTQSIFAVPQFTLWGGGTAGRMAQKGYFEKFVRALVGEAFAPGLGGPRTLDDVASITLIAHSAGHIPVLAILQQGDLRDKVRNVVLIDGFFLGGADTIARWVAGTTPKAPRKFVAVNGKWGANVPNGRAVAAREERRAPGTTAVDPPGSLEEAIRAHTVTVKEWKLEHGWYPLLMLTKTIAGLGLPEREVVPPRAPVAGRTRPAEPLVVGDERGGRLEDGDTLLQNGAVADDYRVDLPAGGPVTVEVHGGPSVTEPCCSLDVFAQVLQDGRPLAGDDDGAGLFDSRIVLTPPRAGAYVVRVTTQGSGTKRGPYTVVVKGPPAPM